MGLGHWSVLVLGDRLVELFILSFLDLLRLSGPNWLRLIAQFPVPCGFVHLLCLWLLLFLLLVLFDSALLILLLIFLLDLIFVLLDFLVLLLNGLLHSLCLASPKVDVEVDELAVLLDQLLHSVLLQIVPRLLLQVERDLGAALQGVTARIFRNRVGVSIALPHILLVVVVL